jgi:vacuolar-type H+-ATPase subunit E/Vma4
VPDEVPWRDYVDAMFREREKAVEAALAAAEKAVTKSEANAEKWRDAANEWRGQSADRERSQAQQTARLSSTFLPRETFDSVVEGWTAWRSTVDQRLNSSQGQSEGRLVSRRDLVATILAIAAVVSVVVTIVVLLHH